MKKLKTGLAMKAAMNEGNLQKAFSLMLESGTIPDRIQGMPFGKSPPLAVVLASDLALLLAGIFLEKAGIEPHTIMGPTALSFGREVVSAFSPEQMKAAEQMQRAWKREEHDKFLAISMESGLTPEKVGGVPYDLEALGLGEAAARGGLRHAISMTVSLDFEGASGMPTKHLKNLLLQNGVDIAGCLER